MITVFLEDGLEETELCNFEHLVVGQMFRVEGQKDVLVKGSIATGAKSSNCFMLVDQGPGSGNWILPSKCVLADTSVRPVRLLSIGLGGREHNGNSL